MTWRGPRVRAGVAMVSGLAVFCAALSGCRVNVGGEDRALVRFSERLHGDVELVAEHRDDRDESGGRERHSQGTNLEQRLRLETSGDVYHPNLLSFRTAVVLGLVEQWFAFDGESESNIRDLQEYDMSFNVLREKPLSATGYLNRSENVLLRQFLGPLEVVNENAGASLDWRHEEWPMSLGYYSSKLDQSPFGRIEGDERFESSRALDSFERETQGVAYRLEHDFSDTSRMALRVERDETRQRRGITEIETERTRGFFSHELLFGEEQEHRLDSTFELIENKGNVDIRNARAMERLTLGHTEDFSTHYSLSLNDSERAGFSNRTVQADAGFTHQLFESLVTAGDVFASRSELDSGEELNLRGGNLNFNYRKSNPWGGLRGTYQVNLTQEEFDGTRGRGLAVDEAHAFEEPFPIILDERGVIASSIVVTDATGLTTYFEGEDYEVVQVGDRVHLQIFPLDANPPNISDGQIVLVDYEFQVDARRERDILRQRFRLAQEFDNGLTVYYQHERQNEDVSSEAELAVADDYQVNTFGSTFSRGGWSVLGEYSERDSEESPFTSFRLEARWLTQLSDRTSLALRGSRDWLDFGAPFPRETTLYRYGGDVWTRFSDRLRLGLHADWRDEEDSIAGRTSGVSAGTELNYSFRQFEASTGVDYNQLDRLGNENQSVFFYGRIKRTF